MANAGYLVGISVSDDDTSYDAVGGANNCSQNMSAAMLEVTEYGDTAMKRIAGLFDSPISISGHRKYADAGQAALVAAHIGRTPIWVKRLHNGTNGYKVQCLVANFNEAGGVGETATFDAQLQSTGLVAVV
jgi:predicted secreted protein